MASHCGHVTSTCASSRARSSLAPSSSRARVASSGFGSGRARRSSRLLARTPPRRVPRASSVSVTAIAVATLEDVRRAAVPIPDALDPAHPDAAPAGPAVFALVHGVGDDATVAYVGVAKRARAAIADAVATLEAAASSSGETNPALACTHVARAELPKTARKPALQAAWKSWLAELGRVPEGNALEKAPAAKGVVADDSGAVADTAVADTAAALADAVVSAEAARALREDGFAVIDDAMPPAALAAALAAAERLRTDGKMRHVGQDGRDDDIAVLAVGGLPKQTSPYAGISAAARFLAAIPDALRARAAEHAAENADVKGADVKDAAGDTSDASTGGYAVVTSAPVQVASGGGSSRSLSGSRAEATMSRLATATAPERLMLAHYPGGEREGARYVPHLDNDPDDPGHREGEPGLRACDRAVTAILYLNPEWEEAHGGCLRVTLEDGRGEADVAPSIGRLVLFDCRRILHEVRPSYAGRWAMTAWIND